MSALPAATRAIAAALMACASTVLAQTQVFSDDFSDASLPGWFPVVGPIQPSVVNQQLVLSASFSGPMDAYNIINSLALEGHSLALSGPIPDNQTLEFRADLAGVNQTGVMTLIYYYDDVNHQGYFLSKSQNLIGISKYWNTTQLMIANFFAVSGPLKNTNVTLVLAVTRHGSNLDLTARVLDMDNADAVLFDRTATDTPASDPVVPSPFGAPGSPDPAGTAWPIANASGVLGLAVGWINPTQAPHGPVQATLGKAQVWAYQTPQLAIQNAIVISWPGTTGAFALQAAANVNGPWATLPAPWIRTAGGQTEVCVPARDSQQFFHLLFNP